LEEGSGQRRGEGDLMSTDLELMVRIKVGIWW
jgi:hypothetical protein